MNTQICRRGERRSVVLLRFEDDDVQFRTEEEDERDDGAQRDAHAQRDCLRFVAAKINGDERHPNHARRVPLVLKENSNLKLIRQRNGHENDVGIAYMANPMNLASLKFSGRLRVLTA